MLLYLLSIMACDNVGGLYLQETIEETDTDTDTDSDTDSDTDADSDADTDTTPDYFIPEYVYATYYIGIKDKKIAQSWFSPHGEVSSYLQITLAQTSYFHGYDEQFACHFYYSLSSVAAGPNPPYTLGYSVTYVPIYQSKNCYNLNPHQYGDDPINEIGVTSGSLYIGLLTEESKDAYKQLYPDWDIGKEIIGGDTDFGDLDINYYQNWYPELQNLYGVIFETNDDLYTDYSTYSTDLGGTGLYYLASMVVPVN